MRNNEKFAKDELQTSLFDLQSSKSLANDWEYQKIENKVELQLYLHFEKMLSNQQEWYFNEDNQIVKNNVSREKIVIETIKYLDSFKKSMKPLPPQHQQQLLFVLDITKISNQIITNFYFISQDYKDSKCSVKFKLSFGWLNLRIDLKKFLSFNNWNHIFDLWFWYCEWFNDDDWRTLVQHADNFKNLKRLFLCHNKIKEIHEEEIEQFKSLELIDFRQNPLSEQSERVLKRLKQKSRKMTINF